LLIGFGVWTHHGDSLECLRLRGARLCLCAHADAVEQGGGPEGHRPAVRWRGAPGDQEDGAPVVDRRITRQELKKALATRTDAIMAV